ncbi:MAG: hypothetical protein Q8R34_01400 [bacterium]|nr:hypothetical protein [bacterium]
MNFSNHTKYAVIIISLLPGFVGLILSCISSYFYISVLFYLFSFFAMELGLAVFVLTLLALGLFEKGFYKDMNLGAVLFLLLFIGITVGIPVLLASDFIKDGFGSNFITATDSVEYVRYPSGRYRAAFIFPKREVKLKASEQIYIVTEGFYQYHFEFLENPEAKYNFKILPNTRMIISVEK